MRLFQIHLAVCPGQLLPQLLSRPMSLPCLQLADSSRRPQEMQGWAAQMLHATCFQYCARVFSPLFLLQPSPRSSGKSISSCGYVFSRPSMRVMHILGTARKVLVSNPIWVLYARVHAVGGTCTAIRACSLTMAAPGICLLTLVHCSWGFACCFVHAGCCLRGTVPCSPSPNHHLDACTTAGQDVLRSEYRRVRGPNLAFILFCSMIRGRQLMLHTNVQPVCCNELPFCICSSLIQQLQASGQTSCALHGRMQTSCALHYRPALQCCKLRGFRPDGRAWVSCVHSLLMHTLLLCACGVVQVFGVQA